MAPSSKPTRCPYALRRLDPQRFGAHTSNQSSATGLRTSAALAADVGGGGDHGDAEHIERGDQRLHIADLVAYIEQVSVAEEDDDDVLQIARVEAFGEPGVERREGRGRPSSLKLGGDRHCLCAARTAPG
jgi:hypothetical protein